MTFRRLESGIVTVTHVVGVAVGLWVIVGVEVIVGVAESVAVGDEVGVIENVGVLVCVGVKVTVGELVAVEVWVGDALPGGWVGVELLLLQELNRTAVTGIKKTKNQMVLDLIAAPLNMYGPYFQL